MRTLKKITISILVLSLGVYMIPTNYKLRALYFGIRVATLGKTADCPNGYIDKSILDAKIKKGLPVWARDQIKRDLDHFPNFNTKTLNEAYQTNNTPYNKLVRFKIKERALRVVSVEPSLKNTRAYRTIYNLLNYLAQNGYVEQTDLIICLQDFIVFEHEKAYPILSFAKDTTQKLEQESILLPDWMNLAFWPHQRLLISAANKLYPWQDKKSLLFWRGGNGDSTGFRKKLVTYSSKKADLLDVKFSHAEKQKNTYYLRPEQHIEYKYQLTIDGARATWERLVWQLHSNCLTFKQRSTQIQWFYGGLTENKEYFGFTTEDELMDKLAWAKNHENEVQEIINRAQVFARDYLNLEDMYHYTIEIIKAYNQKMLTIQ